jgi:hypothetical protein
MANGIESIFFSLSKANKNIKNGIKHFTFELLANENKRIRQNFIIQI